MLYPVGVATWEAHLVLNILIFRSTLADAFKDKTTAPNQLWQTDFTYLKVIGWGWFYLSTILDDSSRFIVAWKLCATMKAKDVAETLNLALQASGLNQVYVVHLPRLLSDNGSSYISGDLAKWLGEHKIAHTPHGPPDYSAGPRMFPAIPYGALPSAPVPPYRGPNPEGRYWDGVPEFPAWISFGSE
jgi:transposase InsO family protein